MFDIAQFDFTFTPGLELEDNQGRFFVEGDDEDLIEYKASNLHHGTGADGDTRIHYHGEIEVATLGLDSALSDALWVTLHRNENQYWLTFRSETPENDEYQMSKPAFSEVPSFGELLYVLDNLPAATFEYLEEVDGWVQMNIESVVMSECNSELYPQLGEWYFAVQNHFRETGDMAYLDDSSGTSIRFEHLGVPTSD